MRELQNLLDRLDRNIFGDQRRERGINLKIASHPAQNRLVPLLHVNYLKTILGIMKFVIQLLIHVEYVLLLLFATRIRQGIVGHEILKHFIVLKQEMLQLAHADLIQPQAVVFILRVQQLANILRLQLRLDSLPAFVQLRRLVLIAQTRQKYQARLARLVQMRNVSVHDPVAVEIGQANRIPSKVGRFGRIIARDHINKEVNVCWVDIFRFGPDQRDQPVVEQNQAEYDVSDRVDLLSYDPRDLIAGLRLHWVRVDAV